MKRIKLIVIGLIVGLFAISAVRTVYKSDPKNLHYHPYRFTEKDELMITVAKFIRAVENGNARNAYRLLSKSEGSYRVAYSITKSYCNNLRFKQGKMLASLKLVEANIRGSRGEIIYSIRSPTSIDTVRFNFVKERDLWRISPSSDIFTRLSELSQTKTI